MSDNHDMFCACPDCLKIKSGVNDVHVGTSTPNQETMRERLSAIDVDFGYAIGNLGTDCKNNALDALEAIIAEACTSARIDELKKITGKLDFLSCQPDCTDEQHARHDGSFTTYERHSNLIDDRIDELQKPTKEQS